MNSYTLIICNNSWFVLNQNLITNVANKIKSKIKKKKANTYFMESVFFIDLTNFVIVK
jgi:hypothetical protein